MPPPESLQRQEIRARLLALHAAQSAPAPAPQQQPTTQIPIEQKGRGLQSEIHPSLKRTREESSGTSSVIAKRKDARNGGGSTTVFHPIQEKAVVVTAPKADFATFKANTRPIEKPKLAPQSQQFKADTQGETIIENNPYYDHALRIAPKERNAKKGFKFIQKGKFVAKGNQIRTEAQLEKLRASIQEQVKSTGLAAELELVTEKILDTQPVPEVEWWDAEFLTSYNDEPSFTIINEYVQHPVPLGDSQATAKQLPPRGLFLTKKEMKKLRKQTRLEKLKEKQDLQRMGLIPLDPPKIRIQNIAKVLTHEYVSDPTKVENQVRKQIENRQSTHEQQNQDRALTTAQKKEKKRDKLENDSAIGGVHVAVFRVKNLSYGNHRFRVDKNAQESLLSGICIIYSDCNLVVVEGGPKAVRKYKHLMLERIDWDQTQAPNAVEGEEQKEAEPNECVLIWEGDVKARQFHNFRTKPIPIESKIRETLRKNGCEEYWDAAKNYVAEDA